MGTTMVFAAPTLPDLEELFLNIPNLTIHSSTTGKPLSREQRKKLISLVDKKNGYLEVKGTKDTDYFAGGQLAAFKTKDQSCLIAWRPENHGDSTDDIEIFRYHEGKWSDVTSAVLPNLTEEKVNQRFWELAPEYKKKNMKLTDSASGTYAFKLPRFGRTIEVYVSSDIYSNPKKLILWDLKFNGMTFDIHP